MSAVGAIEAGSSFIRFFGDFTELYAGVKSLSKDIGGAARSIGDAFSKQTSTGFETASNAATAFQASAATAAVSASTGLQAVTANANSASGAIAKAGGTFSVFGRAQSLLGGIFGNLGGIAKMASNASWALWAASKVMTMMGRDNSALQPWITNLNRVAWGAWGVNSAFKAVSATAAGLRAVASLPGRALGAAGRGVKGLGRGIATTALSSLAMGQSAAGGAADAVGSAGTSTMTGLITGLSVGGPIGAAVGALGGYIVGTFMQTGAKVNAGFFGLVQERAVAWFGWFQGIWGRISDAVPIKLSAVADTASSIFQTLEKAMLPIAYSVENVWIPAFQSGMQTIQGWFSSTTSSMGSTWTTWATEAVMTIADVVANIDLYFRYASEMITMWAGNSILQMGDFFTNTGIWLDWFAENWANVFTDAVNYVGTVFGNLGSDIGSMFAQIWNFIESGFTSELNFDGLFSKLDEGFQSMVKEWPKYIQTELATESPEMKSISEQLFARQQAAKGFESPRADSINRAANALQEDVRRSGDSRFGASSAQSQDAYSAIARYQNQSTSSKPELDVAKQQLTEFKGVRKSLDRIADNTKPPGFDQQRDMIP